MKSPSVWLVIFLFDILSSIETAKILVVVPTPSFSHQLSFRPYTQELARRGHEVTVITADPAFPDGKRPGNLREIDVHNVSYELKRQFYESNAVQNEDVYKQIEAFWTMFAHLFIEQIKVDEVSKLMNDKNQTFDLLILEPVFRSILYFSHIYKIPVIQFSSFIVNEEIYNLYGTSAHPLLYPTFIHQRLYNLTMVEKIKELYKHYRIEKLYADLDVLSNRLMKEYLGPDIPTTSELHNNVDMLFLNVHPLWDNNRPVPPSVIYLGGMHLPQQKELPKDLKTYLDSSKNGVIYMSFGTNVQPSLLSPEKIKMIIKVFSQLPYDVLWKYDKDELPANAKNIKLVKWVPQFDLLRHPNIKLFITQGGLQSTEEAIYSGVPLIGMPMITDQWFNSERYEHYGIGIQMEFETITEDQLFTGINKTIIDKSYRQNVKKMKEIYGDQPQSSLERAIWWTEYVLRHGGAKHLRAPSANISWTEYLELELVVYLLLLLLLTFSFISYIIYMLYVYLRYHFVSSKHKIN